MSDEQMLIVQDSQAPCVICDVPAYVHMDGNGQVEEGGYWFCHHHAAAVLNERSSSPLDWPYHADDIGCMERVLNQGARVHGLDNTLPFRMPQRRRG